jgi:hypothetical protein
MRRMGALLQANESQGPPDNRRVRYRADIQGLRAIAVLAVVADHMAGWPSGSFVGVDVFFVISGYLITGILVREFETRQTISFRGFYAGRIKRILPAGLFVIGVTVCATRVLAGIDRYHFAAKDAIASVLFTANWHFARTGVNYFNQSLPPSPLQHYWSLSVEEQFYLVWPWLLLSLLLLIGLRQRFWRDEHTRLVAGIAIAVICSISLAWAFSDTAQDPTAAYFSTFDRAWELGLGALVAIAAQLIARCSARVRLVIAWVGLLGVLVSLFVVPSSSGFPALRGTWFRQRPGRLPLPAAGWLRYAGACALTVVLAGAGLVVVRAISPTRLEPGAPVLIGRTQDDPSNCVGAAALDPRHRCTALNTGDRVAPLPGQLPDDTGGAYACYAYLRQPMHPCGYGSRRPGAIRVALVGDSHAAALLAALEPQLDKLNWHVTAFTGQTCAWLPPALSPDCPGLRLIRRDLLRRHYAVVIATEIRVDTSSVVDHLEAMRPVAATGARVVVVEDDPSVASTSTACVIRITYSATGNCGTPVTVAYRDPDRLAQAAERIPGAQVVRTRRFYCRHGFCPATIGNVVVYRDIAAHVTASYARTVSPYLVEAIEHALPAALH